MFNLMEKLRTQGALQRSQPVTWCCDSRLRCHWQCDRDAPARGRFQGVV